MSTAAASLEPKERLDGLFGEVAELMGQRNAIDSRLVEIIAEIDRDELAGITGARSLNALVAWKTGMSERNAEVIVAVAHRLDDFPRCADGLREGRLSLDQVGVIHPHHQPSDSLEKPPLTYVVRPFFTAIEDSGTSHRALSFTGVRRGDGFAGIKNQRSLLKGHRVGNGVTH